MSRKRLLGLIKGNPELVERLLVVAEKPAAYKVSEPQQLYTAVANLLDGQPEERLVCVALNRRNAVIGTTELTRGSDAYTVVDPKQIFRWALLQGRSGAYAIALAHNHPSGRLDPSVQDLEVTRRVAEAGRMLGIKLVDHLIVANGGWKSLAEDGHLP